MSELEFAAPPPVTVIDRAVVAISHALSITYAFAVAVTVYDVICDVVFRAPTVWVYDAVTTLIAVAFLIGGSYAMQRREHIRITVVYDLMPARVQAGFDVINMLLTFIYLAVFGWFAWTMAALSVANWEVGGSVWAQPTPVVVKSAMFLGVVMLILQGASNLVTDWRRLTEGAR
jgi:TRAP-type mannitol/chloroaromatic compound transport system permease small subunit